MAKKISKKINKYILDAIAENSKEECIKNLLYDLILEEKDHQRNWWFKEFYKRKLKEYYEKWGGKNEDQANNSEELSAV